MIKGIIGKKLGMSQIFNENGEIVPVTLIQVGPCYVIQKKIQDRDGYDALQLGFGEKKEARVSKPVKGHQDRAGKGYFYHLREVSCDDMSAVEVGQEIKASEVFAKGETVKITGVSKGKGYAGVVRRHNFGGLPASHGSLILNETGSIGTNTSPGKVIKGKKMSGQLGNKQVTVKGLKVVDIFEDRNMIAIRGAVPGNKGQLVILRKQEG
ncbi:MAG TPA: 50S ribosomal protein L3 [Deltaproteobacteria bacterium]|nr:50S ribosomal protein L3 [Deltaproteobacteria bacterium]HPR56580.1 50S ribosomal protein L3 [Deltaproteobacteria bacterium]HXK48181.1 50S ribosomal protein L3 [Deltaproteobacteria bacterium]